MLRAKAGGTLGLTIPVLTARWLDRSSSGEKAVSLVSGVFWVEATASEELGLPARRRRLFGSMTIQTASMRGSCYGECWVNSRVVVGYAAVNGKTEEGSPRRTG